MNLQIKYIKNKGTAKDERIVFKVLKDCELGYYLVFDSTYFANGSVSNKLRHNFWFPDKEVKTGDLVVLYTKTGNDSSKTNKDGSSTHFFYWGLKTPVLNNDEDCIVLVQARGWSVKGTDE